MNIYSSRGQYSVYFRDTLLPPLETKPFYFIDSNVYFSWEDLWKDKKILVLPAGEKCKNLEVYNQSIQWLERQNTHRLSQIVAIGGGALLDCTGFIASTYLRGIEWIQVPTTFLSMVDVCVGGKVGINFMGQKNRIGQFYPPSSVWICDQWLTTLPKKELLSGYGEVIKTAALIGGSFWQDCLDSSPLDCVKTCLQYKALIVQKDEFEIDNEAGRFVLNAGHTVAHGLEGLYPERYLHGEAVSIGLLIETEFGAKMELSCSIFLEELKLKLKKISLPTELPHDLDINGFITTLLKDKKGDRNSLSMSIVTTPGECKMISGIPIDLFKNFLKEKIGANKI